MALWLFLASYSLVGIGYWMVTMGIRIAGAFGRPATNEGHLDVKIHCGGLGGWFVVSALFVVPAVVAYERPQTLGLLYSAMAIVWLIRLQVQVNRLHDRDT